ncbi:MAG TPA: hypothetical protein DIS53_00445 [Candidatus Wildermuthbacteria bacterium]|uniref:Uncharacterized protein n=1 Tax=Candidatus Yanofskybacteria bacterium GW2011_GWC1_48_11 TaxID=1619027 RepID=A0A837IM86_9BACT|nr:MAG: hypothetical protein UY25_C0001G0168 [Candidatus Yanofskybacteria bacterium GW2011_GWC1_48_11]KKW03859.1 MAG: hypothetical protein UY38_C0002G0013 [Parcubacteria group bacterium GW2011_GWB1_49_12]KKW08579.1 MAG: hypothetical protein UY45_C0006G0065 [Parcubacteria group bacterium GW2011_GWA1_49_26]KKW14058.1 MAG: hypothetical protein UY53_C0004G0109 [Parcubacteria group bacterium GW2011_GWA2_50_10]OHA61298.1 MAG: hypothetical protein A2109_03495 [Candidatus Wildermuthbacteria bacterium G
MPTWIIPAPTGPTTGATLVALIENLTDWFFAAFLVLAVLFVLIAAFQFISSRAEPQAVAQARSKLLWAVVAIIAAVFAKGIPTAIRAIIGS